MRNLAGKVVVITGASSGIGAAVARELAPLQARLVLAARRADRLQDLAEQVVAAGGEALIVQCDVGQRPQVKSLVEQTVTRFGRVDVMLANAGYGFYASVEQTTDTQMEDIFRVNVLGTWYAMAQCIPVMRKQKSGHIIVMSSAAARRGLPFFGPYAMTKAAQLSLAEAARTELHGTGVYVSSVHPISTRTDFFDTAAKNSDRKKIGGLGPSQSVQLVARKVVGLMRRPRPELWPSEAARWALFGASMFPGMTDRALARGNR